MKLFNRRNLFILLVVAAVVAALYFWRRVESTVVSARVVHVQPGNLLQTFRTNGVVEPVEFREIRAEFPSRVLEVRVKEGQSVRAGQSLASLDDRDLRAIAAQARSQLLEAEHALARLHSGLANAQLDAQIAQANADLSLAESNLRRNESLLKQRAISQLDFDESAAAQKKAAEALTVLEKQRDAESKHLNPLAEDEAKARMEQARVAVQNADSRLQVAQIPSPMAGTVLQKPPTSGTQVNPGDLLAKVGNIERLQIRAFIDQPDFSSIQLGSPVRIASSGFPGESWQGKVTSLAAELTTIGKRVVGEAICEVDNGTSRLPVNSNVDLTFTSREIRDAQLLPVDAIIQMDGRSYVYIVVKGQLRLREVQVGASNTQSIVIKSGLTGSEAVLNDLEVKPREGMRVQPR